MKNFFEKPTQVAFLKTDKDAFRWVAGIAHGFFITCLEQGRVFEVNEIIADATKKCASDAMPIVELPWVDLSKVRLSDLVFTAKSFHLKN